MDQPCRQHQSFPQHHPAGTMIESQVHCTEIKIRQKSRSDRRPKTDGPTRGAVRHSRQANIRATPCRPDQPCLQHHPAATKHTLHLASISLEQHTQDTCARICSCICMDISHSTSRCPCCMARHHVRRSSSSSEFQQRARHRLVVIKLLCISSPQHTAGHVIAQMQHASS